MISKELSKYVNSLQIKKYRKIHQSFLVQGEKSVRELLTSDFEITHIIATTEYLTENKSKFKPNIIQVQATEIELSKLGTLSVNDSVIAIVKQKKFVSSKNSDQFTLVLDRINDPGNLGTIIRLADWYGITEVICSEDCADFYNPKVISSTMGSFLRVIPQYKNLEQYLANEKRLVVGAYLEGENIHQLKLETSKIVLVMGSESHGISEDLKKFITKKITIPGFGKAESLNVGIATGILVDNLMRCIVE